MESFRDGIIPARAAKPQVQELKIHHESQKAYPNSQEWLRRRGEIEIPQERQSREWGIFILPQLLSHAWEIGNCLE